VGMVALGAGAQEEIDSARAALEQYVETQRVISQEKHDFALAREMLNERIELVKQEIEALRGKIDEARKNIDETENKRVELVRENDRLKEASQFLTAMLAPLESRTHALLARLPDPIRDRIQPLSQRLPKEAEETKLSLSERFQNVVGILNELDKFNREITVTSEVRSLPDGTSAEVTAVYLGVGQAYYTTANGAAAGVGMASETGWEWQSANESAPAIRDAIAVLQNEKPASFVRLPAKIQ